MDRERGIPSEAIHIRQNVGPIYIKIEMELNSLKAKIVSITLELGAETPPETNKFCPALESGSEYYPAGVGSEQFQKGHADTLRVFGIQQ